MKDLELKYSFVKTPEMSDWTCYLFGATESSGMRWNPEKGKVPSWFTRWMMKICFGCTWVRKAQETSKKNMFYTSASTPSPEGSGCWVINQSFRIYVQKKPSWLHKKMVKLMFGWDWEEKK